jgi:hypothetical protein
LLEIFMSHDLSQRFSRIASVGVFAMSFMAHDAVAQYSARTDALGLTIKADTPADTLEEAIKPKDRWTLRIEPAAWYVGVSGKFAAPRSTTAAGNNPQTRFIDVNADNPILTPAGEARLRWNNWLFSLRGFAFNREARSSGLVGQIGTIAYSNVDRLKFQYQVNSFDLEVGYRVLSHRDKVLSSSEPSLRVDVDVLGGARLLDTSIDLEAQNFASAAPLPPPISSYSADDTFIHPFVGARFELEVYEQLGFDVQLTGGYFPGNTESSSVDVIAGFWWEPVNHIMIQVGYRALFFSYTSGDEPRDYSADATLQGLYFGAVVRF